MRYAIILALAAALGGCGASAVQERVKLVNVPVPAPCPDPAAYTALKAARPRPLREYPMPAAPDVRVAMTAAQLGRYEAEGGWADKVSAALDRCQAPAP